MHGHVQLLQMDQQEPLDAGLLGPAFVYTADRMWPCNMKLPAGKKCDLNLHIYSCK